MLIRHTLAFMLLAVNLCNSQVLERNEVDEFTGHKIKQTSYEILCQNFTMNAFVSVMTVNDSLYALKLKLMFPAGVHSIDRDNIFYIKLQDGSMVELHNAEYTLSCTGCGAKGFSGSQAPGTLTTWFMDPQHVKSLLSSPISKIRIYTSKGYIESDVKANRATVLADELRLTK